MLFEILSSAESIETSSVRMIECSGLEKSSADMHLGPTRAHLTLDSTPGETRFLRRLDFSNSLLVTKIEQDVSSSVAVTADAEAIHEKQTAATSSHADTPATELKATALQRCRGLFETEVVRAPTEVIEAVLRPSCLTLDELDGTRRFPRRNLVKLSALFNVSFMSRQALIDYLLGRAALFLLVDTDDLRHHRQNPVPAEEAENAATEDFYVRFLDPTLLREGIIEIASFVSTLEENYAEEVKKLVEEDSACQQHDSLSPEQHKQRAEKEGRSKEMTCLEAHLLRERVSEHFSGAQFPIIYDICWRYMTLEHEKGKTTFNLARIAPLLATYLVSRPGSLTKQTLAELWETCTSAYWFLKPEYYCGYSYSSSTSSPSPSSSTICSDESLLYGFFAKTELKGVVVAPHTKMPLQLVPRIIHLFKISSKWEKAELLAFLTPVAESQKILNTALGRRCREVKDGKNTWCYLI